MFGFGRKDKDEKSPKNTNKSFSSDLGFIDRLFLGKKNVDALKAMESAFDRIDEDKEFDTPEKVNDNRDLAETGIAGTAEVLSIEDTNTLVNYNPVVRMKLNVTPQSEPAFVTTVETIVSKIAIPKVSSIINIKYDPANKERILVF